MLKEKQTPLESQYYSLWWSKNGGVNYTPKQGSKLLHFFMNSHTYSIGSQFNSTRPVKVTSAYEQK